MQDLVLDLSHWEAVTDWDAVKKAGYVGIIYKATEGIDYRDETYHGAREAATAAGLLWGSYHFLRPGDMRAQAQFYVDCVGVGCPLYCADHEDEGVSLEDLRQFIIWVFWLTGKHCVLYSGHLIKEQLNSDHDAVLARCRLWIAHYTDEPAPEWPQNTWMKWWLWQFTETGAVPGIEDETDINRYDGLPVELVREWGT